MTMNRGQGKVRVDGVRLGLARVRIGMARVRIGLARVRIGMARVWQG